MGLWALQIYKSMKYHPGRIDLYFERVDKVQKAKTETSARLSETVIFFIFL